MDFKVTSGKAAGTDKTRRSTARPGVGGASFGDYLSAAGEVLAAQEAPANGPALPGASVGVLPLGDDLPQNAREQSAQLLQRLKELAGETLGGALPQPAKLQELAELEMPLGELSAAQAAGVADVRTRAAVEAEKLVQARKRI